MLWYLIYFLPTIQFYHVFFHFLLVIDVNFLIPAGVKQIINSIAEDPIPAGIPTNKAKEKLKKTFNLK